MISVPVSSIAGTRGRTIVPGPAPAHPAIGGGRPGDRIGRRRWPSGSPCPTGSRSGEVGLPVERWRRDERTVARRRGHDRRVETGELVGDEVVGGDAAPGLEVLRVRAGVAGAGKRTPSTSPTDPRSREPSRHRRDRDRHHRRRCPLRGAAQTSRTRSRSHERPKLSGASSKAEAAGAAACRRPSRERPGDAGRVSAGPIGTSAGQAPAHSRFSSSRATKNPGSTSVTWRATFHVPSTSRNSSVTTAVETTAGGSSRSITVR